MLSPSWITELEKDDPIFMTDRYDILDSFDDELVAILGDDFQISPQNGYPPLLQLPELLVEQQQNSDISNFEHSSSGMNLGEKSPVERNQLSNGVRKVRKGTKKVSSNTKSTSLTSNYDHTLAERKRREQLSLSFIALSAIVPGLKKMDKTSVLGDTVNYLKQLQEKVKIMEETARKQSIESVVLVKKSQLIIEEMDEGSSSDNPLPEIEARICDKSILISIHCEKHKGVMIKILSQMDELNLGIVNINISQFGIIGLHITIIAEMEQEFSGTLCDIVTSLRHVVRCQ